MILREPTISLLQDAGLDEVLESSSDPYIDDLLKSLGVRDRVPDDSSFFLQVGAGPGGGAGRVRQKATQPPVPTSADAVPCSLSKNFDIFQHCNAIGVYNINTALARAEFKVRPSYLIGRAVFPLIYCSWCRRVPAPCRCARHPPACWHPLSVPEEESRPESRRVPHGARGRGHNQTTN